MDDWFHCLIFKSIKKKKKENGTQWRTYLLHGPTALEVKSLHQLQQLVPLCYNLTESL